jgi:hypothetical protein
VEKDIPWGQTSELAALTEKMASLPNLHLWDVVQVMLEHGVLPLQKCQKALWEFAPSDPKTVLSLLVYPREKMWKSLFMKEKDEQGNIWPFPKEGSD